MGVKFFFALCVFIVLLPRITLANVIVKTDDRIELFALLQLLHDDTNPYVLDSKYKRDVLKEFRKWRKHPAVKAIATLQKQYSGYYTLAGEFGTCTEWRSDSLCWLPTSTTFRQLDPLNSDSLLSLCNHFIRQSGYRNWMSRNELRMSTWSSNFQNALSQTKVYDQLFMLIRNEQRRIYLFLSPLNSWGAYNVWCNQTTLNDSAIVLIYGFVDIQKSSRKSEPDFTNRTMLQTTFWHEVLHSYVNPLVRSKLKGWSLNPKAETLRSNASRNFTFTLEGALNEAWVRATVVVLLEKFIGDEAAAKELQKQQVNFGFDLEELFILLKQKTTSSNNLNVAWVDAMNVWDPTREY